MTYLFWMYLACKKKIFLKHIFVFRNIFTFYFLASILPSSLPISPSRGTKAWRGNYFFSSFFFFIFFFSFFLDRWLANTCIKFWLVDWSLTHSRYLHLKKSKSFFVVLMFWAIFNCPVVVHKKKYFPTRTIYQLCLNERSWIFSKYFNFSIFNFLFIIPDLNELSWRHTMNVNQDSAKWFGEAEGANPFTKFWEKNGKSWFNQEKDNFRPKLEILLWIKSLKKLKTQNCCSGGKEWSTLRGL